MKLKPATFSLAMMTLFTAVVIYACTRESVSPSTIQFELTSKQVYRGDSVQITMRVEPGSPTQTVASIGITGNAIYGQDFVTNPPLESSGLNVSVPAGAAQINFTLFLLDNVSVSSNSIVFTLLPRAGALAVGLQGRFEVDIVPSSSIEFLPGTARVDESSNVGISLALHISPPLSSAEPVTLTYQSDDAVYGRDFVTSPAADANGTIHFIVPSFKTTAVLTFLPMQNNIASDMSVKLEIASTTPGLTKGKNAVFSVLIDNVDDEPAANFAVPSGSLQESDPAGHIITLALTATAVQQGNIVISAYSQSAAYGYHYTTDPAPVSAGTIVLPVDPHQTFVTFKVMPVDNSDCHNRSITFTVSAASGGVHRGEQREYMLSLVNDDALTSLSFTPDHLTIPENSNADYTIAINLTPATSAQLNLLVYTNYNYPFNLLNPRIQTSPAYQCFYYCGIFIPQTATQFTIHPINNNVKDGDLAFSFVVLDESSSGCLQSQTGLTIVLVDDDN